MKGAAADSLGEFERIERLEALLAGGKRDGVRLGIGDDAAILERPAGELVWTVDVSVEDVHFKRAWLDWSDVGWRSFHAAVSDLAAMGARPVAALSSLAFPRDLAQKDLESLVAGQAAAALSLGCPVIGGNLSAAAQVSVTTTVLGTGGPFLLRSGARVGDEVWLLGELGMAAAGLRWLASGRRLPRAGTRLRSAVEQALQSWRRPQALLGAGAALVGRAHAALDISDGLVGDAEHLAQASQVSLVIETSALTDCLSPSLTAVANALELEPIELALYGGEDYALLATGPANRRPCGARCIGCVEAGQGMLLATESLRSHCSESGHDHFRAR